MQWRIVLGRIDFSLRCLTGVISGFGYLAWIGMFAYSVYVVSDLPKHGEFDPDTYLADRQMFAPPTEEEKKRILKQLTVEEQIAIATEQGSDWIDVPLKSDVKIPIWTVHEIQTNPWICFALIHLWLVPFVSYFTASVWVRWVFREPEQPNSKPNAA